MKRKSKLPPAPSIDERGRGSWHGGFIQNRRYYLQQTHDGKRYRFPVGPDWSEALSELATFEADPEGYVLSRHRNRTRKAQGALLLTKALIDEWEDHQRNDRHNTRQWVAAQRWALDWWRLRLKGVDLRTLDAATVDSHWTSKSWRHRVKAIKSLWQYLRQRNDHLVTGDPLADVKTPGTAVAQHQNSKVVSAEDFDKVCAWLEANNYKRASPRGKHALKQPVPWSRLATSLLLTVSRGTGWHAKETLRFALSGAVFPGPQVGVIDTAAGTIATPRTKAGRALAARVTDRVLAAATQLRALAEGSGIALDSVGEDSCYRQLFADIGNARKAVGLERFGLGWGRHTKATHDAQQGLTPEDIAAQLGNSVAMVEKHYIDALKAVKPLPAKPLI